MIFCNNNIAVNQWINSLKVIIKKNNSQLFTDITDDRIIKVQSKVDETAKYNKVLSEILYIYEI